MIARRSQPAADIGAAAEERDEMNGAISVLSCGGFEVPIPTLLHDLIGTSIHRSLASARRPAPSPTAPTESALSARTGSMRDRMAMYNANALKIGVFGANCSSGRSATTVPERWSASWPDCLALARLADQAGIDFMLPIGRWKGYGGDTDFHGTTLETVTWACGLLAATRRITDRKSTRLNSSHVS